MINTETLKKAILFKATHRSSKEYDLFLGGFAQDMMRTLPEKELVLLLRLLEQDDHQIFDLIKNPQPPFMPVVGYLQTYLDAFKQRKDPVS